jgi:hypothetical protein
LKNYGFVVANYKSGLGIIIIFGYFRRVFCFESDISFGKPGSFYF